MEIMEENPPPASRLGEIDGREFLRLLGEWKARSGGPEVEVRFRDLSVEASLHARRRSLPTLFNTALNGLQEASKFIHLPMAKERRLKILNGISGIIRPSRMTLILGPPGSGKTTFLRALAGKLGSTLKLTGKITYNGEEISTLTPQNICAYVSQHDLHHSEMTVRETLNFSAHLLGNHNALGMLRDRRKAPTQGISLEVATSDEESNIITNYIIKMLGLCDCADIIVGDELRRGISGGQKKRVTIGEMLVGLATCFFMDGISTGLDSSTTVEIIKFLRQMACSMGLTMAVSLLQPSPETFELFDDIILLCEGRMVYQGPRESVVDFFESMGFKCPVRKNIADFLQEVTSKMDQARYWAGDQSEYQYLPVEKLAESFSSFHIGRLLEARLLKNDTFKSNAATTQLTRSHISRWNIFRACFSREVLLLKRNSPVHIFKSAQIAFMAVVILTLFYGSGMSHNSLNDGNKYLGAIFIGICIVNFNGMAELAMTIRRLPIFYKQRELLSLPGWAFLSSAYILSFPISLLESGVWIGLTYFFIGFVPSAVRFLQQYLVLFWIHQLSLGLYRFIAVVGRTQVMANTLGTTTLIAVIIFGGFVIAKDDLLPWLQWGYWASPFTYAQNAIALNEFFDKRWSNEFHYGSITLGTIGEAVLESRGLLTEWHWFWACVGALIGMSVAFNILSIFALDFLNPSFDHQIISHAEDATPMERAKQRVAHQEGTIRRRLAPFRQLTLVFKQINYYVDMPKEMTKYGFTDKRLQLLQDVNGAFRPGVLTALMGVTGAGKTTLLDVLAGRKTGGYIKGTISINGYPKRQETFSRISGYCEQTDIHSPCVTVLESLTYSALLRLPADIDQNERNMFIEEVMDLVELRQLQNAMVGIPGSTGLSAEQRKRLTIAVELVSDPAIIFMDEPTSGLDARSAAIVMRAVRKTVDTGRTVVCTIHQPSIEIFESFDELLLLKRGGHLIYGGSLGPLSKNIIQYFEAIPRVPKITEGQNPAAWVLGISSHAMECAIGVDFGDVYRNSSLYKENMLLIDELGKLNLRTEDLHFAPGYWPNFTSQCMACLWKQHRSYWKNPEHNVIRFINTLAVSLLFGLVFWRIGSSFSREQDIFNILGALFVSALFLGFVNASTLQPVVSRERAVFYRERSAGMYSSMPYAIAQITIELPYMIIQVLIFSSIVYPMMGFPFTVAKFFWFFLFMLLSFTYYMLFGMTTVALTPNLEMAGGLSYLIFSLWTVFSGFIVPRKMMPVWCSWLYWADPAAWTIDGLMFSQLRDRTEHLHIPGRGSQTVPEFLDAYFGLQARSFAVITALHFVAILVFLLLFVLSIKYLNFQKR